MDHWQKLRRLTDQQEILASFRDSLNQLSPSHADSFKFLTAALQKHPFLFPDAAPWLLQPVPADYDYRALAGFLVHLPPGLRPDKTVAVLWRRLFDEANGASSDYGMRCEVVRVYMKDLTTEWLFNYCLADGFFYWSSTWLSSTTPTTPTDSSALSALTALQTRLAILNELFRRQPLPTSLPHSGLVEKIAQLWPLLTSGDADASALRLSLLKLLARTAASIHPKPLFRVAELEAICGGEWKSRSEYRKVMKLLQIEVMKLPTQVYVLSTQRDRYSRLGSLLVSILCDGANREIAERSSEGPKREIAERSIERPNTAEVPSTIADGPGTIVEFVHEGLIRAVLERWNSLLQQDEDSQQRLFSLFSRLLNDSSSQLKDSTLRTLLTAANPIHLHRGLLKHALKWRLTGFLGTLAPVMRATNAAVARDVELVLAEGPEWPEHLQACVRKSEGDLEWLRCLLTCTGIGEYLEWPTLTAPPLPLPGIFSLLAEHLRRHQWRGEELSWEAERLLSAQLSVDDLKVLVRAFRLTDPRLRLICGEPLLEAVEAVELPAEEMLRVATAIGDESAAVSALKYLQLEGDDPVRRLTRLILRYKSFQISFPKDGESFPRFGKDAEYPKYQGFPKYQESPKYQISPKYQASPKYQGSPVSAESQSHQTSPSLPTPQPSFHPYLESLFPGLTDPTPSDDPLLNLRSAFMYGDYASLRALQSLLLSPGSPYRPLQVAESLPVGALVLMGAWGGEVLRGAWEECCGELEAAERVVSNAHLLSFYEEALSIREARSM